MMQIMTKEEFDKKMGEGFGMVNRMYIDLMDKQRCRTREILDNLPKGGKITFRRYNPFPADLKASQE